MAFWDSPKYLTPKQAHRWIVSFDAGYGQENDIDVLPHYIFKSIERPSYEIGTIQAKHLYSQTFNFPKRVTWKPIKVELNDVVINSTKITMPGNTVDRLGAKDKYVKSTEIFIYSILLKGGYFSINKDKSLQENILLKKYTFKDDLSNAFFKNYTDQTDKQIRIKEISSDGYAREWWSLHNPFINNVNFGKLDYSSDGVINITFDIVYDWAEMFSYPEIDNGASMFGGPPTVSAPKVTSTPPQIEVNGVTTTLTKEQAQQLLNQGVPIENIGEEWAKSVGIAIPTQVQIDNTTSPPSTPIKPSEITGDPTGPLGSPFPSRPPDLNIGSLTTQESRQEIRNSIELPDSRR